MDEYQIQIEEIKVHPIITIGLLFICAYHFIEAAIQNIPDNITMVVLAFTAGATASFIAGAMLTIFIFNKTEEIKYRKELYNVNK